jgi:hypothetical protein
MFALLRRSRAFALVLVCLSPAVGGTLLPAVHPCPVDAPWLAATHAAGHHGGHSAPASTHQHDVCHCVGGCVAAAATTSPAGGIISLHAVLPPMAPGWVSEDASLELPPPSALLPPTTAPPLA